MVLFLSLFPSPYHFLSFLSHPSLLSFPHFPGERRIRLRAQRPRIMSVPARSLRADGRIIVIVVIERSKRINGTQWTQWSSGNGSLDITATESVSRCARRGPLPLDGEACGAPPRDSPFSPRSPLSLSLSLSRSSARPLSVRTLNNNHLVGSLTYVR